jgi:hypothetical protein
MNNSHRNNWMFLLAGLLLGAGIMYAVLYSSTASRVKTIIQEKEVVETVLDTVVVKHKVYVEKKEELDEYEFIDSLSFVDLDSNLASFNDRFTFNRENVTEDQDEDVIISERLVSKKQVTVQSIANSDTTSVEKILELGTNAFANNIQIEFWESPLELIGYELNRSRLKLYGFNPYESYALQLPEQENQLILLHKGNAYHLSKTDRFKRLEVR